MKKKSRVILILIISFLMIGLTIFCIFFPPYHEDVKVHYAEGEKYCIFEKRISIYEISIFEIELFEVMKSNNRYFFERDGKIFELVIGSCTYGKDGKMIP